MFVSDCTMILHYVSCWHRHNILALKFSYSWAIYIMGSIAVEASCLTCPSCDHGDAGLVVELCNLAVSGEDVGRDISWATTHDRHVGSLALTLCLLT
jgi:hypothetical protein